MIIEFNEKKYDVRAEYIESKISWSTKKELNSYNFEIKVSGKENFKLFQNELEKLRKGGIKELDTNDNVLREFKLEKWSYRYVNEFNLDDTVYMCTIWIEEIDKINVSKININGIECDVLKYKEEYDKRNEAIIIYVIIKIEDELDIKLNSENIYFDVIRKELSDEVIKMRFGKITWSQHEGYKKKFITLVEKAYDDNENNKHMGLLEPEFGNLKKIVAYNTLYIDEIINELDKMNIKINKVELKEKLKGKFNQIYDEFYEVEDIEEYAEGHFNN